MPRFDQIVVHLPLERVRDRRQRFLASCGSLLAGVEKNGLMMQPLAKCTFESSRSDDESSTAHNDVDTLRYVPPDGDVARIVFNYNHIELLCMKLPYIRDS